MNVHGCPFPDFSDLLTKLDTIKQKGRLVNKGLIGYCSNSNCWHRDYYQDAFMEYAMYGNDGISLSSMSFFHAITGKIISKSILKPDTDTMTPRNENVYLVSVSVGSDDVRHHCYVHRGAYEALKKGRVTTFEGVFVN